MELFNAINRDKIRAIYFLWTKRLYSAIYKEEYRAIYKGSYRTHNTG